MTPFDLPRTSRTLLALSCSLPLISLANADEAAQCLALTSADPSVRFVEQRFIPAGERPQANPGRAALTGEALSKLAMPGHCLIIGAIGERTGQGGTPYATHFELRLPSPWNGRFLFQGGGGMDGVLGQALGAIPFRGATAQPALNRGYAVVSTDSGHTGRNSSDAQFGLDQQARLDYAYAAIGTVTAQAKRLIGDYYGQQPDHSVFMGCSNGGRSALMAAQRFPTAFDGVIAGNPGLRLSRAAVAQAWDTRALNAAAPRAQDGRPILAQALTQADQTLIANRVLAQCDALDGAKDGSIDAMSQCHFDPSVLQCKAGQADQCLSAAKVTALRSVFEGARDSRGNALYSDWPWDAGIASNGWRAWKLGSSTSGEPDARNATLTPGSLGYYFMTPANPDLKLDAVEFDEAAQATAQTAAINDAVATQMSSFIGGGGKLIVIQGNSDPVFSANDLRRYWDRLSADNGGAAKLGGWAKLFIVPGMTHCGDGPGLDDIDPLTALEQWQTESKAPAQLLARGTAFPGRSRPLCPYPQEAHYRGQGDAEQAESFVCR
ncbi:putative feruloyl esterase B-1 [Pseudomonas reidholzensis]|uniref:Putative feruloyl esterase B-1 n=1 Tax=Pseudomonas reidholzensis TaxID=1785162 RepID=A0A383RTW0_9PSED|nr:tannase/feruloyl esterase family alpha/beta hydrolase [Pseudomonas reidholzensis]SYX90233.1 putative feruloyl esterase B-1 [Pseudomonas reidholzensis]